MNHAGVGDLGLKELSALTCLTYLNLDSRLFSDTGLKHIKGLTNLVVLDLFVAKVYDHGCEHIRSNLSTHSPVCIFAFCLHTKSACSIACKHV